MSRRRGALFLPVDVRFMEDRKIEMAGEKAGWLYLAICLKAKQLETDGRLTRTQVMRLLVPGWQARLKQLIAVGLVNVEDDEIAVIGWLNHNDPAVQTAERRAAEAERKRVARHAASDRNQDACPPGRPNFVRPDVRTLSVGSPSVEGEGEGEGDKPPNPPAPPGGENRPTNPRALGTNPRGPKINPFDRLAAS